MCLSTIEFRLHVRLHTEEKKESSIGLEKTFAMQRRASMNQLVASFHRNSGSSGHQSSLGHKSARSTLIINFSPRRAN